VKIAGDLRTSDFVTKVVRTGSSVEPIPERRKKARADGVAMVGVEEAAAAGGNGAARARRG
jgi:hypothetical protein